MVSKIFDNPYMTGLDKLEVGDTIAVQYPNYWRIYSVEKEIPDYLPITSAIKQGYLRFLQEIDPLLYNVISDKDPTPENGAEVPGVTWYNYITNKKWTLQNKLIDDKYVWISGNDVICADTSRILDFFGDGSAKFLYEFNGTINDTGGIYNLKSKKDMLYTPGIVDKCAKFVNHNYCYCDNITFESSGTISLWAKPWQPYGSYGCLFHLSQTGDNLFSIWVDKYAKRWYVILNNRSYYTTKTVEWDKWTHVALTTNGDFYINGEKVYSVNTTIDLTKVKLPMLIGADRDSSTAINDWYKGLIEEVRFFNRVLSDDEIKQLYNELAKYL